MTAKQQQALRALERAEVEVLLSYNWERLGNGYWTHRKRPGFVFPRKDALLETYANALLLGYP